MPNYITVASISYMGSFSVSNALLDCLAFLPVGFTRLATSPPISSRCFSCQRRMVPLCFLSLHHTLARTCLLPSSLMSKALIFVHNTLNSIYLQLSTSITLSTKQRDASNLYHASRYKNKRKYARRPVPISDQFLTFFPALIVREKWAQTRRFGPTTQIITSQNKGL